MRHCIVCFVVCFFAFMPVVSWQEEIYQPFFNSFICSWRTEQTDNVRSEDISGCGVKREVRWGLFGFVFLAILTVEWASTHAKRSYYDVGVVSFGFLLFHCSRLVVFLTCRNNIRTQRIIWLGHPLSWYGVNIPQNQYPTKVRQGVDGRWKPDLLWQWLLDLHFPKLLVVVVDLRLKPVRRVSKRETSVEWWAFDLCFYPVSG